MTDQIIVLGIMRSGTSLTAELVRRWGAYAGLQNDLWKSESKSSRGYGYMEYIPLQNLNDELLNNNDRVPPEQGMLEEKALDTAYRNKALHLMEGMDTQSKDEQLDAWIWKDARLPLTLPFWVQFWNDPIYVITVRHPAEVALSSAKSEGMEVENLPFSAGFIYWQYCMLNILTHTQKSSRKIFISYDQLIDNPAQECTRLCKFLDEQGKKSAQGYQQRLENMLPQIAQNERHHHYGKSLAEMEQTTREQRALYNFLRVKTMYPNESFNEGDFSLYPGWREYLQTMDAIMAFGNDA